MKTTGRLRAWLLAALAAAVLAYSYWPDEGVKAAELEQAARPASCLGDSCVMAAAVNNDLAAVFFYDDLDEEYAVQVYEARQRLLDRRYYAGCCSGSDGEQDNFIIMDFGECYVIASDNQNLRSACIEVYANDKLERPKQILQLEPEEPFVVITEPAARNSCGTAVVRDSEGRLLMAVGQAAGSFTA